MTTVLVAGIAVYDIVYQFFKCAYILGVLIAIINR